MSRTLSGLFLVGALNRPRKWKRANRENPRTIAEQIGKIPEKSGKSQKKTKKEGQVQIGKHPRLKPPPFSGPQYFRECNVMWLADRISAQIRAFRHVIMAGRDAPGGPLNRDTTAAIPPCGAIPCPRAA